MKKKVNKNRKVYILLIIIIICIITVCGLIYFLKNVKIDETKTGELTLNDEVVEIINNDILTYNTSVKVSCKNCSVDNTEVKNNKTLKDNKKYKIKLNDIKVTLVIDKDIDFKVKDYFGREIHNYLTNKLPFVIESDNSNLKVNEKKYTKDKGYYKVDDYKIESKNKKIDVKINDIVAKNEYDFYFTSGTLSTLYGALFLADSNNSSFIWYGREGTLNSDYLKELKKVTPSKYIGKADSLSKDLNEEVKEEVKNILDKDKNAYFNIYVDEMRYYLVNTCFSVLGIDSNRIKVNYITDGTISYELDYLHYKSPELYTKLKKEYQDLLDSYKSKSNSEISASNNYIIPAIDSQDSTYYLQFPSYFETLDKEVSEIYSNINFDNTSPPVLYEKLSKKEKSKFQKLVNFDKKEFDEKYFKDSDKDYLIIIGNTPMDYGYGEDVFKSMIEDVAKEYKDKYNILFKPHPRALPDDNYTKFFKELGIDILPGKMPMEVITFTYKNLRMGGFPSSLFLSINPDNMEFLFMNEKNEVFEPIQSMLDNELKDVKIIKPKDYK